MSPRLIAKLRAARDGDAGVSLIELLVGMVLMTIVGAMTLALFLQINTSTDSTVDRTIDTASARSTIQAWTAYLRVADGTTAGSGTDRIEWLTPTDMLFHADLFNRSFSSVGTAPAAPTIIWLRLDSAGSLVEEQFSSSATAGSASTTCRVLVNGVAVQPQLFTPYDANESEMAVNSGQLGTARAVGAGCQTLPVTPSTQPTTALQNVATVVIDFVVRDRQNKHPLEFTSQAVLPAVYAGGA